MSVARFLHILKVVNHFVCVVWGVCVGRGGVLGGAATLLDEVPQTRVQDGGGGRG